MDTFDSIRIHAGKKHRELKGSDVIVSARTLLERARDSTGLSVHLVDSRSPLLAGGSGALHRATEAIYIDDSLAPNQAAFVEAHELGHYWLESPDDPTIAPRNLDIDRSEGTAPSTFSRVQGYSPKEHREQRANLFAREFLLPRDDACKAFLEFNWSASRIAEEHGVPIELVHRQLAVSLLLPSPQPRTRSVGKHVDQFDLDASQRRAAEHCGSPLIVEAAPGTGKTRTLVKRIEHLLANGVAPASVLVLTFSNKAANEIRERVAASMPEPAAELWIGTFHAFGLEVLRRFGSLVDVRQPVRVLDQSQSLMALERCLPDLELDHYLNLREPTSDLRNLLQAISRAKDELVSPSACSAAAHRMAASSRTPDDRLNAEKAAEVACAYRRYETALREDGVVDFGDLINLPMHIFDDHPEVLDLLRQKYREVLVDEYQDVNRASALLLKKLVGSGTGLWVVGDTLQSIYRFRGASPANASDFESDYPNCTKMALSMNYRSSKQIVDTFSAFAAQIAESGLQRRAIDSHYGPGQEAVGYYIATDPEAEINGLAGRIRELRCNGVPYREQAVLSRVHQRLADVATGLQAAGVPTLYLGNLFERPEILDLLALISFTAEPHRDGLFRVATLDRYRMSLADVRSFLKSEDAESKTPLRALSDPRRMKGVSDSGRESLQRLHSDLKDIGFSTGPAWLLRTVLFDRGNLARSYLGQSDASAWLRCVATYQFLEFALDYERTSERAPTRDPKREFLDHVRRLVVLGDLGTLRDLPPAAESIDAVRLMTVHASKGLEFSAVHLPSLGKSIFPLSWRGSRCPLPDGIAPYDPRGDHLKEERCLFYVAISRARKHLNLSRYQNQSTTRKSNPSDFLVKIENHLPGPIDGTPRWTAADPSPATVTLEPELAKTDSIHDLNDLQVFFRCPRRYLYECVLGLSRGRTDDPYLRTHRAAYGVLRWLGDQSGAVDAGQVRAEFERAWRKVGPSGHPLEAIYRNEAERIIDHACRHSKDGVRFKQELVWRVGSHTVRFEVDELEVRNGHVILRRIRTGRPPKSPDRSHALAIMLLAGRQQFGEGFSLEIRYLKTDETLRPEVDRFASKREDEVRDALANIATGRYPAQPKEAKDCPRCPHYFICPGRPDSESQDQLPNPAGISD